jgi:hypothetical protein
MPWEAEPDLRIQLAADNPNTTQTLDYTKDKYNAKIRKRKGLS